MTLSKNIQALVIWNNLTAMQRLEVMQKTGVSAKSTKRLFDASLDYVAKNMVK